MNYCKDCKFREQYPFWEDAPLCLHSLAEIPPSPVTGKPGNLYCSTARMEGSICGPDGKRFEPISAPTPSQTGAVELPPAETAARD